MMASVGETDALRRMRLMAINAEPGDRAALEARHGHVWDSHELGREFEVRGYLAPIVVVRRRSDGVVGTLEFQHQPRFYFNWKEDV